MRTLIEIAIISMLAISSVFFIESSTPIMDQSIEKAEACEIGEYAKDGKDCESTDSMSNEEMQDSTRTLIKSIVNSVAAILMAVSVIIIVFGGYKYIAADGKPKEIEDAKKTILSAGIGIVLTLSTYAIYNLIYNIFM